MEKPTMLDVSPLARKVKGIGFLDIGCSGKLDSKWAAIEGTFDYVGFDPNEAECRRLEKVPNNFRSAKYLPHAVSGKDGPATLYKTKDPFCYSLLKPNHPWLARFHYKDLFTEAGTIEVDCRTLDTLAHKYGVKTDIIKCDSQGLELQILEGGSRLVDEVFCIETETGYLQNYVGETTFHQIEGFLTKRDFLLFDIKSYRIGRDNTFADKGNHQPLWCEAVWLYDYTTGKRKPTTERAERAIVIAAGLSYYDYAFELADYFAKQKIVSAQWTQDLKTLGDVARNRSAPSSKLAKLLTLFPSGIKERLRFALNQIHEPENG